MLDRISQKITSLSQNASSSSHSLSHRQSSQNRSDTNNEQQQLSAIERLVSARTALEACGGEVPNMQPLIEQHMGALGNAWPVPVQETEETGELEAFFAGLRRNEDKHHPPEHKAARASARAKRVEENQHQARGFKAALASMKAEQREKNQRQSREFEAMLARMRGEQRDEDQQHTRKVDAAIAGKRKDKEGYHSRGLEAAVARVRAGDQFTELGLFGNSTSSNPPERNHRRTISPKQRSFPLSIVKVDDAETYRSTSGLHYHLLFDAIANSYRVQETREIAVVPAIERSDILAFHVNAIRSVDRKARGSEFLRVGVELESGKEFDLVFVKAEDRLVFLLNVCPEMD